MKTSMRFFCWILVGAMFCAVSLGGCGGGGSDLPAASDTTSGDVTPTPTSGDTSGRGDGWNEWDDLGFELNITGKWRIVETYMVLGTGDYLEGTVGVTDFQLTADGNNLTISTLDGQQAPYLTTDFEGYSDSRGKLTSKGIVVLSGGKYYLSGNDTYKQTVSAWTEDRQNYYTLEGKKSSGSDKWDYLKFTNVYMYNEPGSVYNFTVTTLLTPIEGNPLDDFEVLDPFELFSGTWNIRNASMKNLIENSEWVETDTGKFFFDRNSVRNPYLKTKAENGTLLFAAYDPDYPNEPLEWGKVGDGVVDGSFSYVDTADPSKYASSYFTMMINADGYERKSFFDYDTYASSAFDDEDNLVRSGSQTVFLLLPSVMNVTYTKYDAETNKPLYEVVTTLDRVD